MTKEQARELLDVSESASVNEIRKMYQERYSDFQLRLTNAPTPVLKKLYSGNLTKLEKAFKLLCPDEAVDDVQDLPSAEPNYATATPQRARVETGRKAEPRLGPKAKRKQEEEEKAKAQGGASPLVLGMGAAAILAVAAAVFLLITSLKTNEVLTETETKVEQYESQIAGMQQRLAPLENGEFKIKNGSNQFFYLVWFSATYVDSNGKFVTFDMEDHASGEKCISPLTFQEFKPGRALSLNHFHNQDMFWDGSVVFYSFELMNKSGTLSWYFSGIWSEDSKDGRELVVNPPRH